MKDDDKTFWKNYLANTQIDVEHASFTKVSPSWRDIDFVHDFNRFYFIREGEGYLKVKDQEYYPRPNQLYLLPADVKQSYSTTNEHNTFEKYWCHFTARVGELNLFQAIETPAYVEVEDTEALSAAFEVLIRHFRSDELASAFRLKAAMLEIISYFLERCEGVKLNLKASSSMDKMNTVLKTMEQRLAEDVTVEELAKIVHFHPNYFIQVFKNFTGCSPIQYMNRARIERAKQLLTSTEMSISDIAEKVGIQLFYFSRMFKEHTGYTPTSFRALAPKNKGTLTL